MKGFYSCLLALLAGLSMPVLIWTGAGTALFENIRRTQSTNRLLADANRLPAGK